MDTNEIAEFLEVNYPYLTDEEKYHALNDIIRELQKELKKNSYYKTRVSQAH